MEMNSNKSMIECEPFRGIRLDVKLHERDFLGQNVYGLSELYSQDTRSINTSTKINNKPSEEPPIEQDDNNNNNGNIRYKPKSTSYYVGLIDQNDLVFGCNGIHYSMGNVKIIKDYSELPITPNQWNNYGEWQAGPPPENTVVTNLPFVSTLFRYHIQAEPLLKKIDGYSVVKCTDWLLDALPTTLHFIRYFLNMDERATLDPESDYNLIEHDDCPWLWEPEFSKDPDNYIISWPMFVDAIKANPTLPPQQIQEAIKLLSDDPVCKYFFYSREMNLIKQFYGDKKTFKIPIDTIPKLYETMKTVPHVLCYRKGLTFYWMPYVTVRRRINEHKTSKNKKAETESEESQQLEETLESDNIYVKNSSNGLCKLPELNYNDLEMLCRLFPDTVLTIPAEKMRVQFYCQLKDDYEHGCHTFSELDNLEIIFEYAQCFDAINWLSKMKIIIIEDNRVYLKQSYKNEVTIAQAFEKIIKNRLASRYTIPESEDPYSPTEQHNNNNNNKKRGKQNKRKHSESKSASDMMNREKLMEHIRSTMCDEQLAALEHHLAHPILLINGIGGCGKTKLLEDLASLYKPGEVLSTAFQNSNTGNMSRATYGMSFTTHMLIHNHNTTCCKSPYYKKNSCLEEPPEGVKLIRKMEYGECCNHIGIPFRDCMFEGVRVLLIDEISTMYQELFAKLLASLVHCAPNFDSIVIVGDSYQIGPIRTGNVAPDLMKTFSQLGCAFEFKHNHRVGTEILANNAMAVRLGKPEQIRFDGVTAIHIPIPQQQQRNNNNYYNRYKKQWNNWVDSTTIADLVVSVLGKYNIPNDQVHIITRTNEIKDKINIKVEDYYLSKSLRIIHRWPNGTRKQCQYLEMKYLFSKNHYGIGAINGELLKLVAIEDYEDISTYIDKRDATGEKSKQKLRLTGRLITTRFDTTERNRLGQLRKLVFVPLKQFRTNQKGNFC
jgi:hypothetical protein